MLANVTAAPARILAMPNRLVFFMIEALDHSRLRCARIDSHGECGCLAATPKNNHKDSDYTIGCGAFLQQPGASLAVACADPVEKQSL